MKRKIIMIPAIVFAVLIALFIGKNRLLRLPLQPESGQ
jgi:hypothetical protein